MEYRQPEVYLKGSQKLDKVYLLVSVTPLLKEDSDGFVDIDISSSDIDAYFKSNILLQYGILGYIRFNFKLLEFLKPSNKAVIEINADCLDKLQLILSNRFPAECPIDLSCNILNTTSQYKFKLLKYHNSLSSLVNDDLEINVF